MISQALAGLIQLVSPSPPICRKQKPNKKDFEFTSTITTIQTLPHYGTLISLTWPFARGTSVQIEGRAWRWPALSHSFTLTQLRSWQGASPSDQIFIPCKMVNAVMYGPAFSALARRRNAVLANFSVCRQGAPAQIRAPPLSSTSFPIAALTLGCCRAHHGTDMFWLVPPHQLLRVQDGGNPLASGVMFEYPPTTAPPTQGVAPFDHSHRFSHFNEMRAYIITLIHDQLRSSACVIALLVAVAQKIPRGQRGEKAIKPHSGVQCMPLWCLY